MDEPRFANDLPTIPPLPFQRGEGSALVLGLRGEKCGLVEYRACFNPNVPPLPCPLLHFMEEREFSCAYLGGSVQGAPAGWTAELVQLKITLYEYDDQR